MMPISHRIADHRLTALMLAAAMTLCGVPSPLPAHAAQTEDALQEEPPLIAPVDGEESLTDIVLDAEADGADNEPIVPEMQAYDGEAPTLDADAMPEEDAASDLEAPTPDADAMPEGDAAPDLIAEAVGEGQTEPADETASQFCEPLAGGEDADAFPFRLVAVMSPGAPTPPDDAVLGEVAGARLVGFHDQASMEAARPWYEMVAESVAEDTVLSVSDEEDAPDAAGRDAVMPMTVDANPFAATEEGGMSMPVDRHLVALLDTGSPEGDGHVASTSSVTGGDGVDRHGHASRMVSHMAEENPDVRVNSIQVADDAGVATVSSVYAGIVRATDGGAGIANISLAGVGADADGVLAEAVEYARRRGTVVVASAGNGGYDASMIIPACVPSVISVGSSEGGQIAPFSNCGERVDLYVESGSTSEAAARASGYLSTCEFADALGTLRESPLATKVAPRSPTLPPPSSSGVMTVQDSAYTANGSTITWGIDSNGQLLIRPTSGSTGMLCYDSADGTNDMPPWYNSRASITSVRIQGTITLTGDAALMFYQHANLVTADLTGLDTSQAKSFYGMFYSCSSLSSLDISSMTTPAATNLSYMFYACSSLTSLDVSRFSAPLSTSMAYMFCGCSKLGAIDLHNLGCGSCTTMQGMFSDCNAAATINVSGWNTANVTTMADMFYNCQLLGTLDTSSWATPAVTDMSGMLFGATSLEQIDFGDDFTFKVANRSEEGTAQLYTPSGDYYTGMWVPGDDHYSKVGAKSASELMASPTPGGTWVTQMEHRYFVEFLAGSGTGEMATVPCAVDADWEVPDCTFSRDLYAFSHWTGNNDRDYAEGDVIPANTFDDGEVLSLTAQWESVEMSGTDDPTNPDGDLDGLGDNISFTVPSSINYVVKANGDLVGPDSSATYIENLNSFAIRVSSLRAEPASGWAFVSDAASANADSIELRIGPADDILLASDYSGGKGAVHIPYAWEMAPAGEPVDRVELETAGKVSSLTAAITDTTRFGTLSWYMRRSDE